MRHAYVSHDPSGICPKTRCAGNSSLPICSSLPVVPHACCVLVLRWIRAGAAQELAICVPVHAANVTHVGSSAACAAQHGISHCVLLLEMQDPGCTCHTAACCPRLSVSSILVCDGWTGCCCISSATKAPIHCARSQDSLTCFAVHDSRCRTYAGFDVDAVLAQQRRGYTQRALYILPSIRCAQQPARAGLVLTAQRQHTMF